MNRDRAIYEALWTLINAVEEIDFLYRNTNDGRLKHSIQQARQKTDAYLVEFYGLGNWNSPYARKRCKKSG